MKNQSGELSEVTAFAARYVDIVSHDLEILDGLPSGIVLEMLEETYMRSHQLSVAAEDRFYDRGEGVPPDIHTNLERLKHAGVALQHTISSIYRNL